VRYPSEWYQMGETIAEHFTNLRPAQQRGLTLWVYGSILAHSACQNAVIAALLAVGAWHGLRQYLREWLYDGKDKAVPCATQLDVSCCFGPLLRWIVSWWQGTEMSLAIDATAHGDQLVALVVSVLYRGGAIPIAWQILPANQKGAWMPHLLRLLRLLKREMPATMKVLVMADRGLFSGRLFKRIGDLGWHPLLRLQNTSTFQPIGEGQRRQIARNLVPGPGHAWIGEGQAFGGRHKRRKGTLVVVWATAEEEPWVLLTNLEPKEVGAWWYGLRVWIELGFRALKGMGWRWGHTRRLDPTRVARHWLVLAVATLWVLAYGTRAEDATLRGLPPARLHHPPRSPVRKVPRRRQVSLFQQGLAWLHHQLARARLWRGLWLSPEPWPEPPIPLQVTYHAIY
jgi:hypothetical protein